MKKCVASSVVIPRSVSVFGPRGRGDCNIPSRLSPSPIPNSFIPPFRRRIIYHLNSLCSVQCGVVRTLRSSADIMAS